MSADIKTRLAITNDLPGTGPIHLDKDQSHYLAHVLRARPGEQIGLFNGRDGEWLAQITGVNKKAVELAVLSLRRGQRPEPDIWLAFAPIKKARIDFVAQKATELGAARLMPVMTRRTQVDRVKTDRLAANAREAAEQCERLSLPRVDEPTRLDDLLAAWPHDRHLMFCDEDLSGRPALDALTRFDPETPGPWGILIGPEGGFDPAERDAIHRLPHVVPVSLGPRLLRADTAAMAALSLWQAALGDWAVTPR
ncbi:16S rRNA (uracil(1498)-N(3))-methyltransferase [Yunchengibacter salinarum]|uniref:16S rRNA (uracil(1498)-N(3))-methyltransferase n=1 Tax=Yunchengibacter salinarum TaxID=3133399 RepID=UPI0035B57B48